MKQQRDLDTFLTPPNPTRSDLLLKKACLASVVVLGAGPLLNMLPNDEPSVFISVIRWLYLAFGFGMFMVTLLILGTRSIGRAAGKTTALGHAWYVLARTLLYVVLPSLIITLGIVAFGIITNQPAFRDIRF